MTLQMILALLALVAGAVAIFKPDARIAGAGVALLAVALLLAGR